MNILTALSDAISVRESRLSAIGEVTYRQSSDDRSNRSGHLTLEVSHMSIELLLWESGECEFNYGTVENPSFEHLEVHSPVEVAALVDRVIDLAS
jgi:hypothetical protein